MAKEKKGIIMFPPLQNISSPPESIIAQPIIPRIVKNKSSFFSLIFRYKDLIEIKKKQKLITKKPNQKREVVLTVIPEIIGDSAFMP